MTWMTSESYIRLIENRRIKNSTLKLRKQRDNLLFAAKQALMSMEEGYDAPKIRDDLRNAIAEVEDSE